jgi:hypothetical protein
MSAERQRFEFRFAPAYERAARPFGITPRNAWVQVSERHLEARYGRWRVITQLDNVAAVEVTGPYRFIKTAGPPRLGITDLGLTFASNGDRGVLLSFRDRVSGLAPLRHSELTVTVAEPEELAELIRSHLDR